MLLFPAVGVLGVAWLRIATAALVLAPWTRPWRTFARAAPGERALLLALGACLAVMNTAFYLALDRLPMGVVAAIEFVGTIGVALFGLRTAPQPRGTGLGGRRRVRPHRRALVERSAGPVLGLPERCAVRGLHLLGHRIARGGASGGVERLGAAMAAAFLFVMPIGLVQALQAVVADPALLLAGLGVGICSSVIPYVCDQLAMSRLPRASFALLLALLPATAAIVGAVVLAQVPGAKDVLGILLVMAGVAVHRPAPQAAEEEATAEAATSGP